ncbi:unnamed protein product [Cylicocyclus nassatus]|uniref:Terminase large subunit n=1 Tax=Cylicocyclus nassatus TaxID=53992 RepID=A0AA36GYG6_CYLNA|nr:unnamed protein product [Cylicocyclus nassatus]
MAGQRQPTDLVVMKGKKHLTKAEIEARKNAEVTAPNDKVRPPAYLSSDNKKKFRKLAKELLEIKLIANVDCDALARLLIAQEQFIEVTKQIEETPLMIDVPVYEMQENPDTGEKMQVQVGTRQVVNGERERLMIIQDRCMKQCRQGAGDFGMTVSSRCSMTDTQRNTDRCTQYALDVVSGVIVAGELVKLACQRHLDDLEKAKAAPYKYYFDVEKSEEIINFAEELTIAEGEENENVTAYPFQCFILGSLNGWRTKEKSYRRFRTSYVQLGRQNGKSFLNGILAAYYGNFDGYNYGKIYCTATKQDQANIVFDEIVKFINSDDDLSEWFRVHEHNHTIDCLMTHSEIKALSGDTKSLDGHRAYLGIVDEYHAHKTNQMYKLLEGGIKKLKSALISVITTAGFDLKSPCYKLYEYCCNLLRGVFENDSQFVYIAQLDDEDDMYKKENWLKANPILEFDEDALENLVPVANTARDMGGEDLRDFCVKQLNMWMQWSNSLYIKDIKMWKRCAVLKSLKDFRGAKCYVGVDLSSGGDLTSIAIIIPRTEDGVKKYFVHTHSFIPASRVDEHIKTDKVPYDVWIAKGLVTVTQTLGGIKTDYKYIIKYLEDVIKEFDLKPQLICYDPHNASAFLSDLEAIGFDSVSVTQTAKELNDATVDFRLEILAGNVEIEGVEVGTGDKKKVIPVDELLTWSIANAKTISNNYGEIKIDKDISTDRIDPIDAIIDAWKAAMKEEYKPDINESVNEWLELYYKMQKGGEEEK